MFPISLLLLTTGPAFVFAVPTSLPSSTVVAASEIVCGTAGNATLSACQSILDSWTGQLASTEVCPGAAYNVASVPGCPIYVNSVSQDPAVLKAAIESLMGCVDAQQGTVNGVVKLADGTRVCVGSDVECGSCVEHLGDDNLNEEDPRSLEARAITATEFREVVDRLFSEIHWKRIGAAGTWGKDDRSYFTTTIVSELVKKYPSMNAIVCHTKHAAAFDGEKGVDWFHRNIQLQRWFSGTYGYELYLFKSGTFELHGHGGFINWAWNGVVSKKAMNGAYLVFKSRS